MKQIRPVPISPVSLNRCRPVLGEDFKPIERAMRRAGKVLAGRVIWHLNSTASGGGVAEMLKGPLDGNHDGR